MDDSPRLAFWVAADAPVATTLGRRTPRLTVACEEGRLSAYVSTGPTSDSHLRLRWDENTAEPWLSDPSTDVKSIFLRDLGHVIPHLRTSSRLRLEFTPYVGSPQVATFSIRGFETAAMRLSTACTDVELVARLDSIVDYGAHTVVAPNDGVYSADQLSAIYSFPLASRTIDGTIIRIRGRVHEGGMSETGEYYLGFYGEQDRRLWVKARAPRGTRPFDGVATGVTVVVACKMDGQQLGRVLGYDCALEEGGSAGPVKQ